VGGGGRVLNQKTDKEEKGVLPTVAKKTSSPKRKKKRSKNSLLAEGRGERKMGKKSCDNFV